MLLPAGAPSALSLAPAAKVALVQFYLARKFAAFQFRHMIDRFSQTLVNSRDRLIINAQIMRELIGRLRLVEALQDADFSAKLPERLLFSAGFVSTFYIAAMSTIDFERTAEHALFTLKKLA